MAIEKEVEEAAPQLTIEETIPLLLAHIAGLGDWMRQTDADQARTLAQAIEHLSRAVALLEGIEIDLEGVK